MSELTDVLDVFFNDRPSPGSVASEAATRERSRIFKLLVESGISTIRYDGKLYSVRVTALPSPAAKPQSR